MAIDTTSSFVVDKDGLGVTKENSDGDELALWIGGGVDAPSFLAPINAYYYRENGEIYRQTASPTGTTWQLQESSTGDDFHSGWFDVITGQTVTIAERKQMRVSGYLQNCGTIINNGILVVD